jgi:tRNA pseudouridine38-40 synthase
LTIEYDGTDYVGWQIQPNGSSIQEMVEHALARLLGESVRVHSSGRTDAGVHARGMVVHFHTGRTLPIRAYQKGLNHFLPDDISVVTADTVASQFHARFSAKGKWYRYTLLPTAVSRPLCARYSWQLDESLDVEKMRLAAQYFVGEHDFSAFRGAGSDTRTTVRRIESCSFEMQDELIHFDVHGSGFLKNMIRIMVGTLVEIGTGRRSAASIPDLLSSGNRSEAGKTAPPQGLCLMEVYY